MQTLWQQTTQFSAEISHVIATMPQEVLGVGLLATIGYVTLCAGYMLAHHYQERQRVQQAPKQLTVSPKVEQMATLAERLEVLQHQAAHPATAGGVGGYSQLKPAVKKRRS